MLPPDFPPTRIGLSLQGELYKNCRFLELSTAYRLRVSVTNLSWTRWKTGSVMKYCPVRVLQYISLKTELFLVAPYIFSSGLIYKCTYFCFVSFSPFAQYRQKCNAKLVAGLPSSIRSGNHVSCNQALFKFFPSESRQKEKFPRLSLRKKKDWSKFRYYQWVRIRTSYRKTVLLYCCGCCKLKSSLLRLNFQFNHNLWEARHKYFFSAWILSSTQVNAASFLLKIVFKRRKMFTAWK